MGNAFAFLGVGIFVAMIFNRLTQERKVELGTVSATLLCRLRGESQTE